MSTLPDDVKPPEFMINIVHGGKVQQVPHLYLRDGETWEDFCARVARVSNSLNNDPKGWFSIERLIGCLLGLALSGVVCLIIWLLVR